jgi:hypothetical protein
VAISAPVLVLAAWLAFRTGAALEGGAVAAEALGIAAMAAATAVAPAGTLAVAGAFAAKLPSGRGRSGLAAPEEGLEPCNKALCRRGGLLGRPIVIAARALVMMGALIARVAGLPFIARIARLAGLPRVAGLARLACIAGIPRLPLKRVTAGLATVRTGRAFLGAGRIGGIFPAVRAECGPVVALGPIAVVGGLALPAGG